MMLEGKRILITGASEGFGLAVAERCLAEGADVAICARSPERIERAGVALRASAAARTSAWWRRSRMFRILVEVKALVANAARELGGLDGLVNNAGIYGPKGLIEEVDWAEWVARDRDQPASARCCRCRAVAAASCGAAAAGKIVNLSGGGATAPLPRLSAYAASKAAVVRFTETLAEELRGTGIDMNAVAPGALNTRLLDEVLAAGPDKVGKSFYDRALQAESRRRSAAGRGRRAVRVPAVGRERRHQRAGC